MLSQTVPIWIWYRITEPLKNGTAFKRKIWKYRASDILSVSMEFWIWIPKNSGKIVKLIHVSYIDEWNEGKSRWLIGFKNWIHRTFFLIMFSDGSYNIIPYINTLSKQKQAKWFNTIWLVFSSLCSVVLILSSQSIIIKEIM